MPASQNQQLLNYLYWLKERGLSSPAFYRVETHDQKTVCDSCGGQPQCEGLGNSWVVWVTKEPLLQGTADRDLLEKMMQAMRIPRERFGIQSLTCCVNCSLNWEHDKSFQGTKIFLGKESAMAVVGGDKAFGEILTDDEASPYMITYHPSELLQDASLKVGAWRHLQTIMKTLQQ